MKTFNINDRTVSKMVPFKFSIGMNEYAIATIFAAFDGEDHLEVLNKCINLSQEKTITTTETSSAILRA